MKQHFFSICSALRLLFISPDIGIVNEDFVAVFHEIEIQLWPWTIKTEAQFQNMKQLQIQTVITDIPQR